MNLNVTKGLLGELQLTYPIHLKLLSCLLQLIRIVKYIEIYYTGVKPLLLMAHQPSLSDVIATQIAYVLNPVVTPPLIRPCLYY